MNDASGEGWEKEWHPNQVIERERTGARGTEGEKGNKAGKRKRRGELINRRVKFPRQELHKHL